MEELPLRILILDDDPMVAFALARVVRDAGARAELAHCEADAVAALAIKRFDAVLSDYNLGACTSEEFLQYVRKEHPRLRVVLCTGSGVDVADRVVARGLADAAVLKPAGVAEVLAALVSGP
jgi:DNA-binding NtrC family response regulator